MAEQSPANIKIGSASVTSCGVTPGIFKQLNRTFDMYTRCDIQDETILDVQGWDSEQLSCVWDALHQELPEHGDFLYFYVLS
jgi:hypothetical protein